MIGAPGFEQQVTFLSVQSLDASAAFYGLVLGLEEVLDQGPCRIFRSAGDAFIGFCRPTANLPPEPARGVILTLVVPDQRAVDAWYARLLTVPIDAWHGGRLERAPALNPTFNIYHLFLRDPDSYLVEIQAFLDPSWPRTIVAQERL